MCVCVCLCVLCRYGPLFGLYLGPHYTVVVNNHQHAREVLLQRGKDFAGRPKMVRRVLETRLKVIELAGKPKWGWGVAKHNKKENNMYLQLLFLYKFKTVQKRDEYSTKVNWINLQNSF